MSNALRTTEAFVDGRKVRLRWALCEGAVFWIHVRDLRWALGYNARGPLPSFVTAKCHPATAEQLGIDASPAHMQFVAEEGVDMIVDTGRSKAAKEAVNDMLLRIYTGDESGPSDVSLAQEAANAQTTQLQVSDATSACNELVEIQKFTAALQAAIMIDSSSIYEVKRKLQVAIDNACLPSGSTLKDYVAAADILRERAHTEAQVTRLAGELGKDLKAVAVMEGRARHSMEQCFGAGGKPVDLYHRIEDAQFIEDVFASFKERDVYRRVMADLEDPVAKRKREGRLRALEKSGRGRPRHPHQKTVGAHV